MRCVGDVVPIKSQRVKWKNGSLVQSPEEARVVLGESLAGGVQLPVQLCTDPPPNW